MWSAQPAHEPLIPKWLYDELNAQRQARRGSRDDNQPNRHPQTRRTYLLRGMLFCACGRRMYGNQRHHAAYYTCWPKNNNRGRPDKYAGHPKAVYLREDAVLDAVSGFFADRVFGRQRRPILAADLATVDDREAQARAADRQRLHRRLADVARRQNSILRQAQDGDPDDPFTRALRSTYNDLDAERLAALSALATLDATDPTIRPDAAEVDLLDALPYLTANLSAAPEALLRRLFEATNLTVRLSDDGNHVAISIRLPADTMPQIVGTVEDISQTINEPSTAAPSQAMPSAYVDAVRAPGRIRTCGLAIRSRLLYPAELRGRGTSWRS